MFIPRRAGLSFFFKLLSSELIEPLYQRKNGFSFFMMSLLFNCLQLRVYTASNVREELEEAKREFLQSNVVVKKSRKVFLPKMLERFAREASFGSDDLLKWVTENADKKLHDSIQKCLECKSTKKASQIIEWLPYSSRFRYVFSKDLSEKPWWL